jgi:adenine/guanine phosphoribosyltransferase-like PRPP-binding protein
MAFNGSNGAWSRICRTDLYRERRGEKHRGIVVFNNRFEAGQKLANAFSRYPNEHPAILALPRGGVPVAAEIAGALDAPLDLIMVRKIGVSFQPE